MNSLIAAFREDNPSSRVVIFDIGGSYQKLISNLGGSTVSLTPDSSTSLIAAFMKRKKIEPSGFTRQLIETFCGSGPHITHSHKVAIEDVLSDLTGEDFKIRRISEHCIAKKERVYLDVAHWLKPYLKLDEITPSNEIEKALGDNVCGFDFKALDANPELQRLTILILSGTLWEHLEKRDGSKTLIIFDEVWKFFAEASSFLEEMYRTLRKYFAGIVSITQNLSDYGNDSFAKLVVTNSNTKILLQNGASSKILKTTLDLSDSDTERALSVHSKKGEYSEFLALTPQFSQIFRLYPSEDLYRLANTESAEREIQ